MVAVVVWGGWAFPSCLFFLCMNRLKCPVWLSGPHGRLQGLNVHGKNNSILWKPDTFEMTEFHKKTFRAFKPSCVRVGIFQMIFIILHISHLIIPRFHSHFSNHHSCWLQYHYSSCFYNILNKTRPSPKGVKWIWDYNILIFEAFLFGWFDLFFFNLLLFSRFHLCL